GREGVECESRGTRGIAMNRVPLLAAHGKVAVNARALLASQPRPTLNGEQRELHQGANWCAASSGTLRAISSSYPRVGVGLSMSAARSRRKPLLEADGLYDQAQRFAASRRKPGAQRRWT